MKEKKGADIIICAAIKMPFAVGLIVQYRNFFIQSKTNDSIS